MSRGVGFRRRRVIRPVYVDLVTSSSHRQLEVSLVSDPSRIAETRRQVEAFCRDGGLAEQAAGEVGLCLNEALANVMRHAYGGQSDRPIHVIARDEPDRVVVSVRDWGNGVDPCIDQPRPHDPTRPGGLGLICLRTLLDDVTFAVQEEGMLLTMVRFKLRPVGSGV